jgi:cytidine deaminase
MKEKDIFLSGFLSRKEFTKERIRRYGELVREAKTARAYPDQSGFFVRTAGITKSGVLWKGGNKEYGHTDAFIHGETAVISGLKDITDDPIEAIAWYKDGEVGPHDAGRPCGNCRDILKKYCSPDTILINGNEKGFVAKPLSEYLFEEYHFMNFDFVVPEQVSEGLKAIESATDIYLPERLHNETYGAVLVGRDGTMWRGSHYTNVGYDSVTPVLSAVLNWKNTYPTGETSRAHLLLSKLIVVGSAGIPNVFYRDRQAILELDEVLRRFISSEDPLRVELIHANRSSSGEVVLQHAKKTDTEEWLPYPFSPGAFRMDDVMQGQLQKLISPK